MSPPSFTWGMGRGIWVGLLSTETLVFLSHLLSCLLLPGAPFLSGFEVQAFLSWSPRFPIKMSGC